MSLKIEKTFAIGLFAIKEKGSYANGHCGVSSHVHTTRTAVYTRVRYADLSTCRPRRCCCSDIEEEDAMGNVSGHHASSFLSPRWFNEPIRRSFPSCSSSNFLLLLLGRRTLGTLRSILPFPLPFPPILDPRVIHPFVACSPTASLPAMARPFSPVRAFIPSR